MDPRLNRAASTIRKLREKQSTTSSLSSQLSQDNHNVLNESIGEPYPDIPYTIQSYVLDGNNIPNKLELQLPIASSTSPSSSSSSTTPIIETSDIPVNTYILPSHIQPIRYSIPFPHNEPLTKSGPSTKRISTYRKSMLTESMCIESHIGVLPGVLPGDNDKDTELSTPPSLASVAPPFRSAFDPTRPVTTDLYNNFRDFVISRTTDPSLIRHPTYAERIGEQMRTQQLRGDQPELVPHVTLLPTGYHAAEANIQDEDTLANIHRIDARLRYELPYRTVDRSSNFRQHYDQTGKDIVQEQIQSLPQRSKALMALTNTKQDFYTPSTKELLTSLTLFRYGLQEIHATRQRQNAQLNRDPSNTQFIHYHRSLPFGRGISLYPNNTGIYTIPRHIPAVGSALLVTP